MHRPLEAREEPRARWAEVEGAWGKRDKTESRGAGRARVQYLVYPDVSDFMGSVQWWAFSPLPLSITLGPWCPSGCPCWTGDPWKAGAGSPLIPGMLDGTNYAPPTFSYLSCSLQGRAPLPVKRHRVVPPPGGVLRVWGAVSISSAGFHHKERRGENCTSSTDGRAPMSPTAQRFCTGGVAELPSLQQTASCRGLPAAPGEPQQPVSIATVICELQSPEGGRLPHSGLF